MAISVFGNISDSYEYVTSYNVYYDSIKDIDIAINDDYSFVNVVALNKQPGHDPISDTYLKSGEGTLVTKKTIGPISQSGQAFYCTYSTFKDVKKGSVILAGKTEYGQAKASAFCFK